MRAEQHEYKEESILLVEDNEADSNLVTYFLKEHGFPGEIHVVTDGVEAMDFLFRRNDFADAKPPDFILLDLNLPRKNGWEVLSEINRDPTLSKIPVIVLTTSTRKGDVVSCYANHAACYLTKPYDLDEYGKLIERLLTLEFPRLRRTM